MVQHVPYVPSLRLKLRTHHTCYFMP